MREKNVNARDIMERRLAARAIDGGKNCGCWVQRHIGASECRTVEMCLVVLKNFDFRSSVCRTYNDMSSFALLLVIVILSLQH